MILQALHRLAELEELIGDPDFEYKPVAWVIRLREDGTLVKIEDNRSNLNEGKEGRNGKPVKPKWQGKNELVPRQPGRTSGDFAFFLVDKSEYALGKDPVGARPAKKLAIRIKLFRDDIRKCFEQTQDASAGAVVKFLDDVADGKQGVDLPPDCQANDQFAFKVGLDRNFVHLHPDVKAYWKQQRRHDAADQEEFQCLVTGQAFSAPGLFPLIKKVPGGTTSGVALVSFNTNAFESYGLTSNQNAPICREAAEACATALNRLLHPAFPDPQNPGQTLPIRHFRLSNDTAVVFWSSAKTAEEFLNSFNGLQDPALVAEQFRSIWTGQPPTVENSDAFYAMTLTGVQGRVVVRDWLETTVGEVQKSLSTYFKSLEIIAIPSGMREEGLSLAPPPTWDSVKAAISRDSGGVSGSLMSQWLRVAMNGQRRLPENIASRVLARIKVDLLAGEPLNPTAFAILKAWHVRNGDHDMESYLNKEHPNPAYHCGRLFAVLSFVQGRALGETDSTVIRRFFGGAMTAPSYYFGRLQRLAEVAHLPKLRNKQKKLAEMMQDEIIAINVLFEDGIPKFLSLSEQSYFVLGFYHELAHLKSHPPSVFKYRTRQGEWVRSRGELALANAMSSLGLQYLYEPTVWLPSGKERRKRLPDFVVYRYNGSARRDYIEYLGMMDRSDYRKEWEEKLSNYDSLGIRLAEKGEGPNGRLFVMEASESQPDEVQIREQLEKWFGITNR